MPAIQSYLLPRHRRLGLCAWLFAASSLLHASSSAAQTSAAPGGAPEPPATPPPPDSGVTLVLEAGTQSLIKLAFPNLERRDSLTGAARTAADELDATLRADLTESRIFEIQGPPELAAAELTGDREHDFEQIRSLNNEILLSGALLREGDRLVLEATLSTLGNGKSILGKRYRGGLDLARHMAHTFADEIVSYFTGRPGIARTTIAFSSDRDQPGRKEIYLMDYDGFNQRRLTAHRSTSMSPAWSLDGLGVAYTSFFNGTPAVYFAEIATGRKTPISTEGRFNASPSLSPDGQKVAFARSLDGNVEIFVADRDGRNARQLTHSSAIDTNPAWSPKGNELAFTSSRAGSPQIYVMDPEGTNVRRITFDGEYNDNAAWNPDGTKIAYSSRRDGRFQVAVTDVVTLETRVLTTGQGSHEDPSFSPDGKRLAFAFKQGPSKQIWVMDAETGANGHQLTTVGNNDSPSWSPHPR